MTKKFAVFDIDGTLFRSALFLELVLELDAMEVMPHDLLESANQLYRAWLEREHERAYQDYLWHMTQEFDTKYLDKIRHDDLVTATKRVMERKGAFTYVYTRDLAKRLKSEGYILIAISGSPQDAVEEFTRLFGFDICSGLQFDKSHETLSSILAVPDHNKAEFLQRIVAEHDLSFDGSVGVGDTAGDIPMLELVENPIAFNPNRELFQAAQTHDWNVVVERKNMIYELEPTKDGYLVK